MDLSNCSTTYPTGETTYPTANPRPEPPGSLQLTARTLNKTIRTSNINNNSRCASYSLYSVPGNQNKLWRKIMLGVCLPLKTILDDVLKTLHCKSQVVGGKMQQPADKQTAFFKLALYITHLWPEPHHKHPCSPHHSLACLTIILLPTLWATLNTIGICC